VAGVFDVLVAALCRSGFEQVGAALRRSTHRPALPTHLHAAGEKLRKALAAKPLEPPARKDLAADPAAHQALRFLIHTGEAVEVGPELVLLAESYSRARESVQSFLRVHGSATVSQLREALTTNRRVIVPLLEHLDRTGLTRREGDKRTLRAPR
jgi:selenocysteine-specific elongation factor